MEKDKSAFLVTDEGKSILIERITRTNNHVLLITLIGSRGAVKEVVSLDEHDLLDMLVDVGTLRQPPELSI